MKAPEMIAPRRKHLSGLGYPLASRLSVTRVPTGPTARRRWARPSRSQTQFGNARVRNSVSPQDEDSKQSFEDGRPQTEFGNERDLRVRRPEPKAVTGTWKLWPVVLVLAGLILFCHGCHGDEDNELLAVTITESGVQ
jgi:hypothetical protein